MYLYQKPRTCASNLRESQVSEETQIVFLILIEETWQLTEYEIDAVQRRKL